MARQPNRNRSAAHGISIRPTRRVQFLAELNDAIPWRDLARLIAPRYPQKGKGRQPIGVETMLRVFLLQKWYCLSDPQAEDAIRDSYAMRSFVGGKVPDETTILRFRHLLLKYNLDSVIFDVIDSSMAARGRRIRSGTIHDAAVVRA